MQKERKKVTCRQENTSRPRPTGYQIIGSVPDPAATICTLLGVWTSVWEAAFDLSRRLGLSAFPSKVEMQQNIDLGKRFAMNSAKRFAMNSAITVLASVHVESVTFHWLYH